MFDTSSAATVADTLDPEPSLDRFLAGIECRAFRFAEYSLGNREDALDAIQDTMIKLMAYRERPPAEWTPLFWSILRSRIVDTQRRGLFRMRWLAPNARKTTLRSPTGRMTGPTRRVPRKDARPTASSLKDCVSCLADSAKRSRCASWKSWTVVLPRGSWVAPKVR